MEWIERAFQVLVIFGLILAGFLSVATQADRQIAQKQAEIQEKELVALSVNENANMLRGDIK